MHKILKGIVNKGRGQGKKTIVPTANINLHQSIAYGVYISETKVKNRRYPSVTFIGPATTFSDHKPKVETHIINQSMKLYGKWMSVKLIKKIRNQKTFKFKSDLKKAVAQDIITTKKYFNIE